MHSGVRLIYRRRIRQVIVLVFTIIIGILLSQATQAGDMSQKPVKIIQLRN